jgi:flagellar motility protein MotE (MotC chaperone)
MGSVETHTEAMATTQTTIQTQTQTQATENLVRRLSSLEERIAALTERKNAVKASIAVKLNAAKLKKIETIYGNFIIREDEQYDFSSNAKIQKAIQRVEVAKAKLKSLEDAAKANMEPTIKKTPAFYRNKAVSAMAKKGRIYVATIFSRSKITANR